MAYASFFKVLTLLIGLLTISACHQNSDTEDQTDLPPIDAIQCTYEFGDDLHDIYGTWEPQEIINIETGDTVKYNLGLGHTGFILNDHYADALELRPDSSISLYYTEFGRHCAESKSGIWDLKNDTLFIQRGFSTLVQPDTLLVLMLTKNQFQTYDFVNFNYSKCTYRKTN